MSEDTEWLKRQLSKLANQDDIAEKALARIEELEKSLKEARDAHSKYPFSTMEVGEVFTYNRTNKPKLGLTAYKYAERVRERTGEPFGLQLTTKTVGESRITTVTRVE